MAAFNKYNKFVEDFTNGVHDLFGTDHTFKILLSNTAPNAATHTVKADATEISAGNGYVAGGVAISNNGTRSGGTVTVAAVDQTITASGGAIGPFRYAIVYNSTASGGPLMGWWDYGASTSLNDTEALVLDFLTDILATFT